MHVCIGRINKYGQFFVTEVIAVKFHIYPQGSIYTNYILVLCGIIFANIGSATIDSYNVSVNDVWHNGFGSSATLKMKDGDEIEVEEFYEEEYQGKMQKRVKFPFTFLRLEEVLEKGYHTVKVEPHIKEGKHLAKKAKNGNTYRVYKAKIKTDLIFITAWGDDYKYFDKAKTNPDKSKFTVKCYYPNFEKDEQNTGKSSPLQTAPA